MIDYLEKIDQTIVLTVNHWNNPFLDQLMWIISGKLTWIPLYIFLIYLSYKSFGKQKTFLFVCFAVVAVILSDLTCTHLFKNVFLRYRPSHNFLLKDQLHLYVESNGSLHRGGKYGFISSHAANFFAISIFSGLSLKKNYNKLIYFLLVIAIIVSFSRLYLGVHYLSDLLVGGLVGSFYALICFQFLFKKYVKA